MRDERERESMIMKSTIGGSRTEVRSVERHRRCSSCLSAVAYVFVVEGPERVERSQVTL